MWEKLVVGEEVRGAKWKAREEVRRVSGGGWEEDKGRKWDGQEGGQRGGGQDVRNWE